MLTENDESNDGKLRGYLKEREQWSNFDPPLYELLSRLLKPGLEPAVKLAGDWDVLPGAAYFSESFEAELPSRKEFFKKLWGNMADRPLLFLDPDNGLEVPSAPRINRRSSKHIYWDEIKDTYSQGHSLVLYQHFHRKKRDDFIKEKANQITACLSAPLVAPFRTANVVFFLVSRPEHVSRFQRVHECILQRWLGQIESTMHA